MIDPSAVYRLSGAARYRKVAGEGVVLQQSAAEILMLNDTGSHVLELIDGERRVGEIVERIAIGYEVSPTDAARDVSSYIEELVEAGVVCLREP